MSSPARGGHSDRLTIIERLFIAMLEKEPDTVLGLIHPQAEWTPTVWSGQQTYKGPEGVREWLAQFGPGLECLDLRVERVEAETERGAVLGTVFDSREGGMFAVRVAWSFELEQGLMRRGRAHDSWDEALRAVGLAEGASSQSRRYH
ncbi:MAG TPA: nuclear transport factor 2 family protein [Solirubrobacterales bacterium]|nr:nuclear transport factor 2 family protein [Solirubrobacterales bacterium]